jgi:predicted phage terminase large subunit-like protein
MTIAQSRVLAIAEQISAQRRTTASKSPEHFARVYLERHMRLPPSRMHIELFDVLKRATEQRGQRIAIAAPRGHAKSTVVSLAYVLWSILYGHDKFVLIISATREQAVQLLKSVKDEIQSNCRLLTDFPEACQPPGAQSTPSPWRDNKIILRNDAMVRALGASQQLRGTRHQEHRPSLIVVDDLENQEYCESAEQRHKLRDWFEKTLLKAGDERTNVIVIGTILHYDSLLANLTYPKLARGKGVGWEHRIYQAVESFADRSELWDMWEAIRFGEAEHDGDAGPEAATAFFKSNRADMLLGATVLWPELEGYLRLMEIRADEGRISFQSEKQNEPLDPEECLFSEGSFKYWDDEHMDVAELLAAIGPNAKFYGACDPSMGKRRHRGDYTAIITLVQDRKTKTMYVIDADIARRKPDETIDRVIALARVYRYNHFAFEANQFQEVFADQLRARVRTAAISFYPKSVTNTAHKQTRIESLEPLIASGQLRFSRRHQLLLEQLRQFPLGAHDDGPDALEMAVDQAMRHRVIGGTTRLM